MFRPYSIFCSAGPHDHKYGVQGTDHGRHGILSYTGSTGTRSPSHCAKHCRPLLSTHTLWSAIPPISSTDYHPMSCWILSCLSPSPNDEKIPQPPPSCWLPVRLQLRPHCMAARGGGGDVHTCAPPLLTSSARTRGYMNWAYKPPPSECCHHLGILTVSKGAMLQPAY